MSEGFFSKYFVQPLKNSYNYITGKKEVSDDTQNTINDVVQESSESLDTYVESSDNNII